ncbi:hypothetical protein [Mastigocoleus testarum]|uniref:Uncharacterized protein n=1 Tax=Mastigocoleus testarum BC008 TaxID=371196 RepID=A0A0V7ZU51_9CYAN|nr:hypothetical protein [Mastigocoleus testarum]KST67679.1 hypothetical protein BC008_43770 [Mastigocoleus testarum BC008]
MQLWFAGLIPLKPTETCGKLPQSKGTVSLIRVFLVPVPSSRQSGEARSPVRCALVVVMQGIFSGSRAGINH